MYTLNNVDINHWNYYFIIIYSSLIFDWYFQSPASMITKCLTATYMSLAEAARTWRYLACVSHRSALSLKLQMRPAMLMYSLILRDVRLHCTRTGRNQSMLYINYVHGFVVFMISLSKFMSYFLHTSFRVAALALMSQWQRSNLDEYG